MCIHVHRFNRSVGVIAGRKSYSTNTGQSLRRTESFATSPTARKQYLQSSIQQLRRSGPTAGTRPDRKQNSQPASGDVRPAGPADAVVVRQQRPQARHPRAVSVVSRSANVGHVKQPTAWHHGRLVRRHDTNYFAETRL